MFSQKKNLMEPPNQPIYRKFREQKSTVNDATRVQSANPDE